MGDSISSTMFHLAHSRPGRPRPESRCHVSPLSPLTYREHSVPTIRSLVLLSLMLACSRQDAALGDHRASDQATIRGLDSAWGKAMAAKNVEQTVSYYADNASILSPGEPIATGKAAIMASWASLLTQPGSSITFAPTTVDVSGDRAYEVGDYEITETDKAGKPQTTKAKYVVVRGRQADGTWKVLVDVSTTTH